MHIPGAVSASSSRMNVWAQMTQKSVIGSRSGVHVKRGRSTTSSSKPLASATSNTSITQSSRPKQRTKEDLRDPANTNATGRSSTKVQDAGGDISLTTYMSLPVEQYFVLDPKQIRHIGKNRFLLMVPRINIFNIWLEPEVEILVTPPSSVPRVVLQAENCRIRASESVERLRLDQRFCLTFNTELTWSTNEPQGSGAAAAAAAANATAGGSNGGSAGNGAPAEIIGNAKLDVWCEVIPPFNLMPRSVMEAGCNTVMSGLVNALLPLFMRRLGADYTKWAADAEYRRLRATRSQPLSEHF